MAGCGMWPSSSSGIRVWPSPLVCQLHILYWTTNTLMHTGFHEKILYLGQSHDYNWMSLRGQVRITLGLHVGGPCSSVSGWPRILSTHWSSEQLLRTTQIIWRFWTSELRSIFRMTLSRLHKVETTQNYVHSERLLTQNYTEVTIRKLKCFSPATNSCNWSSCC